MAVPLPLERRAAPGGSPRLRFMADAIRKDALAWLFGAEGGGWRQLHVVVAGRRRELCLWDQRLFPLLEVRFTSGPLRLLVAAMESRLGPPPLPAELLATARASFAAASPPTGDLLAYHRICSRLSDAARGPEEERCPSCAASLGVPLGATPKHCRGCGLRLQPSAPAPTRRERREALFELSPLTLLFRPAQAGERDPAALRQALAPIFRGERPTLLSYLAPALASSWLKEERGRRSQSVAEAEASYARAGALFAAYVEFARLRPDAFRPLIAFYRRYVAQAFGGRAPVVEALRIQAREYDRISEGDEFLRTASRLFLPACAIQSAVDDALGTPFVDRSEAQKVLLSDYHEHFRGEVASEVEAIRRELAGELG